MLRVDRMLPCISVRPVAIFDIVWRSLLIKEGFCDLSEEVRVCKLQGGHGMCVRERNECSLLAGHLPRAHGRGPLPPSACDGETGNPMEVTSEDTF